MIMSYRGFVDMGLVSPKAFACYPGTSRDSIPYTWGREAGNRKMKHLKKLIASEAYVGNVSTCMQEEGQGLGNVNKIK